MEQIDQKAKTTIFWLLHRDAGWKMGGNTGVGIAQSIILGKQATVFQAENPCSVEQKITKSSARIFKQFQKLSDIGTKLICVPKQIGISGNKKSG